MLPGNVSGEFRTSLAFHSDRLDDCSRRARAVIDHELLAACSEHARGKPVADVVGSNLTVVDLAVFCAAFLTRENLERLVLRADGVMELVGDLTVSKTGGSIITAFNSAARAIKRVDQLMRLEKVCVAGSPT